MDDKVKHLVYLTISDGDDRIQGIGDGQRPEESENKSEKASVCLSPGPSGVKMSPKGSSLASEPENEEVPVDSKSSFHKSKDEPATSSNITIPDEPMEVEEQLQNESENSSASSLSGTVSEESMEVDEQPQKEDAKSPEVPEACASSSAPVTSSETKDSEGSPVTSSIGKVPEETIKTEEKPLIRSKKSSREPEDQVSRKSSSSKRTAPEEDTEEQPQSKSRKTSEEPEEKIPDESMELTEKRQTRSQKSSTEPGDKVTSSDENNSDGPTKVEQKPKVGSRKSSKDLITQESQPTSSNEKVPDEPMEEEKPGKVSRKSSKEAETQQVETEEKRQTRSQKSSKEPEDTASRKSSATSSNGKILDEPIEEKPAKESDKKAQEEAIEPMEKRETRSQKSSKEPEIRKSPPNGKVTEEIVEAEGKRQTRSQDSSKEPEEKASRKSPPTSSNGKTSDESGKVSRKSSKEIMESRKSPATSSDDKKAPEKPMKIEEKPGKISRKSSAAQESRKSPATSSEKKILVEVIKRQARSQTPEEPMEVDEHLEQESEEPEPLESRRSPPTSLKIEEQPGKVSRKSSKDSKKKRHTRTQKSSSEPKNRASSKSPPTSSNEKIRDEPMDVEDPPRKSETPVSPEKARASSVPAEVLSNKYLDPTRPIVAPTSSYSGTSFFNSYPLAILPNPIPKSKSRKNSSAVKPIRSEALQALQTVYAGCSGSTEDDSRSSSQNSRSMADEDSFTPHEPSLFEMEVAKAERQQKEHTELMAQAEAVILARGKDDAQTPPNEKKKASRRKADVGERKSPNVPMRKSTRINREQDGSTPFVEDLVSNFTGTQHQDRGVIVPRGPSRTPFQFVDRTRERLNNQLLIAMEPTFKTVEPSYYNPKPNKRKLEEEEEKEREEVAEKQVLKAKEGAKIMVGKDHQAVIPDEMETAPHETYRDDLDELVWVPPTETEIRNAVAQLSQKKEDAFTENFKTLGDWFYQIIDNVYWRAIWRQFRGHIPYERALQHLMQNNFSISYSLDTVDESLMDLPQEMKPLCLSQVKKFQKLFKNKKRTLRMMQERSMRNYHLGEVQNYLYQFRRFYKLTKGYLPCTCNFFNCFNVVFEPRYGCRNCTKGQRDTEHMDPNKLCMICQTYTVLTDKTRPARHMLFTDSEKLMIEQWEKKEGEAGRVLTREEVEDLVQEDNNQRWRNNQLTPEEKEMVNYKELKLLNRHSKAHLTPEEKEERGQKLAALLQPFPIPHFIICRCAESGSISFFSPHHKKRHFTEDEQVEFRNAVICSRGNIECAARLLNVEEELVERFLGKYDKDHEMWKGFPYNSFHNYPPRPLFVPWFMPKEIPEDDPMEKPEGEEKEKGPQKKRHRHGTKWTKRKRAGKKREEESTSPDLGYIESPETSCTPSEASTPEPEFVNSELSEVNEESDNVEMSDEFEEIDEELDDEEEEEEEEEDFQPPPVSEFPCSSNDYYL